MKKYLGWLIGIIIVLGLIIVGEVKHRMDQQKQLQQEMVKIVKSEEVQGVIEEGLRNLDTKAFTDNGVIKSYQIDETSIKRNPMGGIVFSIYINDDSDLYQRITLNRNTYTGKYSFSGGYSSKLDTLLQEKRNE
ncbi:DUF1310 domain-containing protein [Streptococcus suis]|nr:DUF1310 domain-containing protein [Streptococcus suis]